MADCELFEEFAVNHKDTKEHEGLFFEISTLSLPKGRDPYHYSHF